MNFGDQQNIPGWRIEQRYAPGVLIGNWSEERHTFPKNAYDHNSTHRIDFQNFGNHRPDVLVRRKAQMQSDGMKKEFLFNHHGDAYTRNMITWYDTDYNKRPTGLAPQRDWDGNTLSWAPEKSDFPLQGEPTNWGLRDEMNALWTYDKKSNVVNKDLSSTYQSDFLPIEREALVRHRAAIPATYSTSLHKPNYVNKDIVLRGKGFMTQPEVMPTLPPIHAFRTRSVPIHHVNQTVVDC